MAIRGTLSYCTVSQSQLSYVGGKNISPHLMQLMQDGTKCTSVPFISLTNLKLICEIFWSVAISLCLECVCFTSSPINMADDELVSVCVLLLCMTRLPDSVELASINMASHIAFRTNTWKPKSWFVTIVNLMRRISRGSTTSEYTTCSYTV